MITMGETALKSVTLDEAAIRAFAASCGDFNPLHHDAEYAKGTRFGGLIACGPHYLSLLMGLMATHYTAHGPQVGIDFSTQFRKPVRPGDTIELKWVVTAIEPKAKGDVVTLDGTITNQHGETVLTSVGKLMAFRE
jgi:3-hydroxybutyryl-CoA dehydratase